MVFKECSIGGVTFRDQMDNLICTDQNLSTTRFNERAVRKFLEVLALCHTVQATKKITAKPKPKNPLDLVYNAASPDEKAIVEACRNYGVAFLGEYILSFRNIYMLEIILCSFGYDEIANSFPWSIITGEKEKHGSYWYKLLTSRSSRVHKTVYERLHVLEFNSNRKVSN